MGGVPYPRGEQMADQRDFALLDLGAMLAASKRLDYRRSVTESFNVLINFLQANGLTRRELLGPGQTLPPAFKLLKSELTEEGYLLFATAVQRWLAWIDKGNPVVDVSIMERGLKKLRGAK